MKNMSHELSHMKDTSYKLFKSHVSGSYHIGKKRSHRLCDDISHELFEDRTLIYERKQPRTLTYERHESQTIEDTSHELMNTRHTVPNNESRHMWVSLFSYSEKSAKNVGHNLLKTRVTNSEYRWPPDYHVWKTWVTNSLKTRVTNSLRTCVTIPFKTLCEIPHSYVTWIGERHGPRTLWRYESRTLWGHASQSLSRHYVWCHIRMWYKSAKDMSHELCEDTSHGLFEDIDPHIWALKYCIWMNHVTYKRHESRTLWRYESSILWKNV